MLGRRRLGGVVAPTESTSAEQNREHLRIVRIAPQRDEVDQREEQTSGEKAVEQVEGRRADEQRQEEQPSVDTAHSKRPMQTAIHDAVFRSVHEVLAIG